MNLLTPEKRLIEAFGTDNIIYLSGPSCGKTTLAKRTLEEYGNNVSAYINCHDVPTLMKFYQDIADQLISPKKRRKTVAGLISDNLKSQLDFVKFTQKFIDSVSEHVFVILDDVDAFEKSSLIDGILVLSSIKSLHLILISTMIDYEFLDSIKQLVYRAKIQGRIIPIDLELLSQDEMITAILSEKPARYAALYEMFVNNLVRSFYRSDTLEFRELKYLCQVYFDKFLLHYSAKSQLAEDEYNVNQALNSFRKISQDIRTRKSIDEEGRVNLDSKIEQETGILLAAAYIAAYTRPSHDKINFIDFQVRKSGRVKENHEMEPKMFTLERLLQIHRSLVYMANLGVDWSLSFTLNDVDILEQLDFLHLVAGDGLDSQSKYKISNFINQKSIYNILERNGIEKHFFGLPTS